MKHSLIITSLLLLSSFVTSCDIKKDETLYRWKTSSGLEWKTMGDKNKNTYYQGEIKREYILFGDYILEGLGSVTYPDGNKYVGEWKDGERNGQGTRTYPDGSKYVGGWKDGEENGQGTYTSHNGRKYVGEYKDGKRNGQGTYTFSDGRKYVGEIKDNNFWNGIYYDKDGNILGKYVDGK